MNTKSHNYVMGASTVTRATLDWVLKELDEGSVVRDPEVQQTAQSAGVEEAVKMCAACHAIICDGATVEEALKIYNS